MSSFIVSYSHLGFDDSSFITQEFSNLQDALTETARLSDEREFDRLNARELGYPAMDEIRLDHVVTYQ
jgi:hypothetical protein